MDPKSPNVNLNLGGILGAVCGGAAVMTIGFLIIPHVAAFQIGIFSVVGVVGGAMVGNYLWTLIASNR